MPKILFYGFHIKVTLVAFCSFISSAVKAQSQSIDKKVDSLTRLMTIEEKIGQLNQYSGDWEHTGPITLDGDKQNQIREGKIGSMLNVIGVEHTRFLQEIAMQSRLKIPLLFGQDVIHGFRTTFPIPLAQSCSWDMNLIEKAERVAAKEASAYGIHWVFAPMVDIARDPRWGRVMEGSGEDTYLGSQIAAARVRGFQGKGIGNTDAVMACVKHYAAYGAAIGGRDYNSVDMSRRNLFEYYLPPFKAAVDAGAGSVMTSFNDINGVPSTANSFLLTEVLRNRWKFKGIVVSDWGSVGEMVNHGYAEDNKDAAMLALNAGCDIDMESRCYKDNLLQLIKEKKISMDVLDQSVKRVLRKKFELGLFEDPFRFSVSSREYSQQKNPDNKKMARELARKSIVLLKNQDDLLPLKSNFKNIACIGPFIQSVRDNLGFWSMEWPDDSSTIITQWEGLRKAAGPDFRFLYAKGCSVNDQDSSGFDEAYEKAMQSDVVLMSMGEARDMSGEAKSRSNLHLPGVQEELIRRIAASGKPVVLIINAGRPLVFNWAADHVNAILYAWWLGSEAGNALGDVLFGHYNPSGKLTMTFPRSEGQIPVYYNHYNTGRPATNDSFAFYTSGYIDQLNSPSYPFGFGLSYSRFKYGKPVLNKNKITGSETLKATVEITNTGNYDGEETVQLYIHDLSATLVRPVRELKAFKKVFLKKGEAKTIDFELNEKDLRFYHEELINKAEPGRFELFIGSDSSSKNVAAFEWTQ